MTASTEADSFAAHDPGRTGCGRTPGRLHRWAFAAVPSANRWTHLVRVGLRIVLIMAMEFSRTHLAIRASALTYAILLSLVPVLALSTAILKGLGNDKQLKQAAVRFVDQLEAPVLTKQPVAPVEIPVGPSAGGDELVAPPPVTASTHLHRAIDIIFGYVDRTNFAALGAFGVLGLIVVILLVLASIEEAMNVIWHTHRGRPLLRKLMDYMALLILLPISLNVALAAEAILASPTMMNNLAAALPSPWLVTVLVKLAPLGFIVITLTVMYLFFPHVKVRTSAALVGAVFASIFWFLFQKLYIVLQVGVANYNTIYGSFASIPLFLLWLQTGWTCILLGASLAYAIQHQHQYSALEEEPSPQLQLQIAFDVLRIVYHQFGQRRPATLPLLCAHLPTLPGPTISRVVDVLVAGGLLHSNGGKEEDQFVPVTPVERLTAGEVVRLLFGDEPDQSTGGRIAAEAIAAAVAALNTPLPAWESKETGQE